jgi:excisionase family DNA binding protein
MELVAILTTKQTAQILQFSEDKVLRLLNAGVLPGVKIGGTWRMRGPSLFRWFEASWEKKSALCRTTIQGPSHCQEMSSQ